MLDNLKKHIPGILGCLILGSIVGWGVLGVMPAIGKLCNGIPVLVVVVALFTWCNFTNNKKIELISTSVFIATLGFNLDSDFVNDNYIESSILVGVCATITFLNILFKKSS
ncbi:hypothetical protein ABN117_13940 [Providencia manganoxydans]|uniref:hypothetical protein n=1 Tax=Providencia manganoxydans TaxID=2923283 RepID=UPI0032DAB18C